MRKIKTKSLPEGHVALPLPVYRRLQALVIDSHRSEAEILEMAIRIFATAIARIDTFKLPKRTPKPLTKKQRSTVAPIGATAKRIVDNLTKGTPSCTKES